MDKGQIKLKIRSKEVASIPPEDYSHADYDKDYGVATRKVIVIFSTPRSGSTLLCELLHKNSICLAHEYLQRAHYMPLMAARWKCLSGGSFGKSKLNEREYVKNLLRFRTQENGCFGINVHGEHISSFLRIEKLLPNVEFHYLHITRNDRIQQAVSYEIASQTRQWSKHFGRRGEPKYSYYGIWHKLYRINRQNTLINAYLDSRGLSSYSISYEDLLRDPKKVLGKIPWVDLVGGANIDARLVKQSNNLNEEWVKKFSDRYLSSSL